MSGDDEGVKVMMGLSRYLWWAVQRGDFSRGAMRICLGVSLLGVAGVSSRLGAYRVGFIVKTPGAPKPV
ncbi:hypothetical protein XENTR_v10017616 [Xenopus tropicalis]|nr:hypothetical protein XENTR_v10017616 [Xenopus tropicalis]